jgi:hypothetical protein
MSSSFSFSVRRSTNSVANPCSLKYLEINSFLILNLLLPLPWTKIIIAFDFEGISKLPLTFIGYIVT